MIGVKSKGLPIVILCLIILYDLDLGFYEIFWHVRSWQGQIREKKTADILLYNYARKSIVESKEGKFSYLLTSDVRLDLNSRSWQDHAEKRKVLIFCFIFKLEG